MLLGLSMDSMDEPSLFQMFRGVFHDLPGWKKAIIVVSSIGLSPLIALVAGLLVMALFPVALLGRFEGDLGESPVMRELATGVRHQQARTRHYYAT